jgi:serine protease Do
VLINQVYPDSAADKAGLQVGDIVTEINGKRTPDNRVLLNMIAQYQPGETITIKAFRKGKEKSFDVTLGDRSVQFASLNRPGGRPGNQGEAAEPQASANLGLSVEQLTPEIAQELNAADKKGVVISAVEPGSAAADKGLQLGDIITMVGEQSIASLDDFNAAMKAADASKGIALQVTRGEAVRLVVLKAKTQSKSD